MYKKIKEIIKKILSAYPKYLCKKEYYNHIYTFNERPVEFRFIFEQLAKIYPDSILDVGTGTTALPHLMYNCGFNVTAIDNITDYWKSGMFNRHYYVIDNDITSTKLTEKYDLITCVSVLEHIEESDVAVSNMFSLLNDDGYLVLTCPYSEKEYIDDVYKRPLSKGGENASYICQSFSRKNLNNWVSENNASILKQEFWRFFDGEFWTEGNENYPPVQVKQDDVHQLTCVLLKKNSS
jgi:2-polyprenyl-3-methyl-5-hydroxy-6-metoxy-1,4-benzoquinol methylase